MIFEFSHENMLMIKHTFRSDISAQKTGNAFATTKIWVDGKCCLQQGVLKCSGNNSHKYHCKKPTNYRTCTNKGCSILEAAP